MDLTHNLRFQLHHQCTSTSQIHRPLQIYNYWYPPTHTCTHLVAPLYKTDKRTTCTNCMCTHSTLHGDWSTTENSTITHLWMPVIKLFNIRTLFHKLATQRFDNHGVSFQGLVGDYLLVARVGPALRTATVVPQPSSVEVGRPTIFPCHTECFARIQRLEFECRAAHSSAVCMPRSWSYWLHQSAAVCAQTPGHQCSKHCSYFEIGQGGDACLLAVCLFAQH